MGRGCPPPARHALPSRGRGRRERAASVQPVCGGAPRETDACLALGVASRAARAMGGSAALVAVLVLWCGAAAATLPPATEPTPAAQTSTVPADLDTIVPEALTAASSRVLRRRADGRLPDECKRKPCVPKCCPPGQTYATIGSQHKQCVPSDFEFDPYVCIDGETGRNLSDWNPDEYFLLVGNPCKSSIIIRYNESDFYENGSLLIINEEDRNKDEFITQQKFCMEYSPENDRIAFECIEPKLNINVGFIPWLYTFGLLLSVSCLILTLLVYVMLETLRDLHGKSLIGHVGSLAVSYLLLASVQLSGETGYGQEACRSIAFAIQFFLLSSFLWLHVMCVDSLWAVLEATGHSPVPYPRAKKWTFSPNSKQYVTGLEEEIDEKEQEDRRIKEKMLERRVFVGYFFYVIILSFIPVMSVLKDGRGPTIPFTYLDTNMKLHNCDLDSNTSWAYFYPIPTIITIINIIVFIVIVAYAAPFRWNPNGPQRVPKQKARMCFLLFSLMSSNWIFDIISWAYGGRQFALVILHAFYILQGLITFVIFVLEDRVRDRIKHKLIPHIQRVARHHGCCDKPQNEEEATALRVPRTNQTMGWVVP